MTEETAAARYTGTVKSFRGQWGFLVAEGVEGDAFFHVKDSPAIANAQLKVGETIEFDLSVGGPNNQARATNCTRLDGADSIPGIDGLGAATLTGTVKSFRGGWGLIDSPSVEGSLYFGERDNPQCKEGVTMPGDEVTFEVAQNPKDGRSKAVNVQVAMKDQSECLGQRVRGVVKQWQEGWGFATSGRFHGSILLGRKQVTAAGIILQVGEPVEFEVALAPNGKYEGVNISKVNGMGHMGMMGAPMRPMQQPAQHLAIANGQPGAFGAGGAARDRSRSPYATQPGKGQYIGSVKTFRGDWGFLVCDQLPGDIFVKMRDSPALGLQPLQPGEAVSFDLVYRAETSEKNNGAIAMNCQRLGGPFAQARPAAAMPALPFAPRQVQPPAMVPQAGAPMMMRGPPAAGPAGAVGSQHTGTVIEFKPPPDNWGWLQAPTCASQVFFGLRDNPQLTTAPKVGDVFTFQLADGAKGRSKAVNCTASMVGQRVQGVIRKIMDGGFGFAEVEGVQGNVMLGKRALGAAGLDAAMLQVNEVIEFEVAMSAKGYEASNIRKL